MFQANTDAIMNAKDNIPFTSLDQLAQGAAVLKRITAGLDKSELSAKTLDMEGREAAVQMIGVRKFKNFFAPNLSIFLNFLHTRKWPTVLKS